MIRHLHEYMFAVLLGFLSTSIWAWNDHPARLLLSLGLATAGLVTAYLYLRKMLLHQRVSPDSSSDSDDSAWGLRRAAILTAGAFLGVFFCMAWLLVYTLLQTLEPAAADGGSPVTESSVSQPEALDQLADQIEALTAAIRNLPAPASLKEPDVGPAAQAIWSPEARLALPLTVRVWVATVSAVVLGLVAWVALRGLGTGRAMAALPALALSATAGGMSFKLADKISIERLLDCGDKACLSFQVGTGAAPIGLRALEPSPPFAVGAGRVDASGSGCSGADNSAEAWNQWQRGWLEMWTARRQPSASDVVVLVGSADRQALGKSLLRDFESNAGLARARAEAVRERMLAATAALPDERHRLQAQRVLVLTSGPAHTGGPLRSRSPACDDAGLRKDRQVQVWLHAVRQP